MWARRPNSGEAVRARPLLEPLLGERGSVPGLVLLWGRQVVKHIKKINFRLEKQLAVEKHSSRHNRERRAPRCAFGGGRAL